MSELDFWIGALRDDGWLLMAFGTDVRHPALLGFAMYWPTCTDAVLLVDEETVVSYTTPATTAVWWPERVLRAERGDAGEGSRDRVLRQALDLGRPEERPPTAATPAPPWAGIPYRLRDPRCVHPIVPATATRMWSLPHR
ncbi:hypothetical protein [Actinophytocola xanthii]|uniref:Uncharacterized protein n=1 Tax=Actinophytocola xanthii TaxID=1912961 RepID=A0A1Q8CRJ3_9PSEU|nr:hypothetical protein [Actinophytocola xanthii]OLF16957.1 hypothetical protein BU204_13905 [Actinophytocola xanthii]